MLTKLTNSLAGAGGREGGSGESLRLTGGRPWHGIGHGYAGTYACPVAALLS